ncbi:hypothetical protein VNO78_32059 [Psophocarpus tetragonolobus]|uniref:Uncharacterized protein n=1 Tax=Psophocarpus tetragonolobus TaxID=3891 RepID=A0AAN9RZN7_PSOTE
MCALWYLQSIIGLGTYNLPGSLFVQIRNLSLRLFKLNILTGCSGRIGFHSSIEHNLDLPGSTDHDADMNCNTILSVGKAILTF